MSTCLLRNFGIDGLCYGFHPLYIGLHGSTGKGGRVGSANIPSDYAGVLLADSPARQEQADIYAKLEVYAKTFERAFEDVQAELFEQGKTSDEVQIKSLYLWSESPGTGKTTTAAALLNEWLLRYYIGSVKRGMTPPQRIGYFLDANQLQTDYTNFNRPKVPDSVAQPAAEAYYRALEHAKQAPFVVIDDVATRSVTEGFRSDLHSVVNHRVTNELPTIYTSNLPIDRLSEVFGEQRLADRIRDMTQPIHFNGESKRGRR